MSDISQPQEIKDHHTILGAIKSISALEELAEVEPGLGYKFGVDLEVALYGRNYGPGKKVGPYFRLLVYPPGAEVLKQGEWETNTFFIVVDGLAQVFIDRRVEPIGEVGKGRPFGEMAVLSGTSQTYTVKAHAQQGMTVLEVQRPALRILRKLQKFGTALDLTYRNKGREFALTALAIPAEVRDQLVDIAEFTVLARGHDLCREGSSVEQLILIKEGWVKRIAPDRRDQGDDFADFLGPGHCLGLNVLEYPEARWPYKVVTLSRTEVLEIPVTELKTRPELLAAVRRAFIPYASVGTPIQPGDSLTFTPEVQQAQARILDKGLSDATNLLLMDMDLCVRCGNCSRACHMVHHHSRLTRRGIHFVRPQATLMSTRTQNLLSPAVCLHCKDPECLTGCPTGAIARFAGGKVDIDTKLCIGCGDCATQCPYNAISLIPRSELAPPKPPAKPKATLPILSAPRASQSGAPVPKSPSGGGKSSSSSFSSTSIFSLIGWTQGKQTRNPEPGTRNPNTLHDWLHRLGLKVEPPKLVTSVEDLVAIKCNLCTGTPLNPTDTTGAALYSDHKYSCEENCPTGALMRVSPTQYFEELGAITGKAFRTSEETTLVGNTAQVDVLKRRAHLAGIVMTILMCGSIVSGIVEYGLGTPLWGTSWMNLRWISGCVGLFGIAVVMTYPIRRQIWKHRVGPLRYWMLGHTYAGVIAGLVILLHGGTSLGGLLTTALMISFDLVILTGLVGILIYQLGPRLLTQIEEEPLLLEDLVRRREELYQEIADLLETAQCQAREHQTESDFLQYFLPARDRVLKLTTSLSFLFRNYLYREPLDVLLEAMTWVFQADQTRLKTKSEQVIFKRIVEAAVTARRIDALIYLHRALRLWLPPHVITTSFMLVLLLAHIFQVIYYLWR
ncbi:MAG: cyclic nucleotide-binding domain-containing protein [Acidobacteria bacterium]|nr:cyclic nucleotide-binding domain-containing protein [Acidobacteriota bacterium]